MNNFSEYFAGIGLVRLGLEQAEWTCAFANDIDAKKKKGYALNFEDSDYTLGDTWDLLESIENIPDTQLATASFPCTDLSVAGDRRGLVGTQSGSVVAFLTILNELKHRDRAPNLVMLENVRGFLTANNGSDIRYVMSKLNEAGYAVDLFSLDAKFFTPQSRPRVFLVGAQKHVLDSLHPKVSGNDPDLFGFQHVEHGHPLRDRQVTSVLNSNQDLDWVTFDLPYPPERSLALDDIIENFQESDDVWWRDDALNKVLRQIPERHLKFLNQNRDTDSFFYGTLYRRVRAGETKAELRSDGIAGCLRTPRGGSSKQIVVRAGRGELKFRWMSAREYARLQGVPDDFAISDNYTEALFGMGDAVCVPAIRWIAENLLNKLNH